MEAYPDQERREEQPDDIEIKLQEKMSELTEIRDELHRAKDDAMQSWLDSKPLIDELEKLQAGLASAKNRISMSNIVISELKSQLQIININIETKLENESKAKEMIDELNQTLEQKHRESEAIKLDADEERRARSNLKQVLWIKRLTLRTLKLTFRATRIESEAFGESAAEVIGYIKSSESDSTDVQLSRGEYYALKRRAKEETALAEWRISVSIEQKLATEESRNFALSRLKELNRRKSKEEKKGEDEHITEEVDKQQSSELQVNSGTNFCMAQAEAFQNKSKLRKVQQKSKKKKPSILSRIRSFLVLRIARFFG